MVVLVLVVPQLQGSNDVIQSSGFSSLLLGLDPVRHSNLDVSQKCHLAEQFRGVLLDLYSCQQLRSGLGTS